MGVEYLKTFLWNEPTSLSTGYIMTEDTTVAEVKNDNITIIREWLCPILILKNKDFPLWLQSRSIDTHRPNSRKLRKMLRITTSDERGIVLKNNAVSVTDNYWFKPVGSNLTWKDVDIEDDRLWRSALEGYVEDLEDDNIRTLETTLIGSYEKCWRREGNTWVMYKKDDRLGLLSEFLASKVLAKLKFNVVDYRLVGNYVLCNDFTNGRIFNYEPISALVGGEEDYRINIDILRVMETAYRCELVEDYLDLLLADYLVCNVDRHTDNYGILRDTLTGDVKFLAPNFDNNLSLFKCSELSFPKHSYTRLLEYYLDACAYALEMPKTINLDETWLRELAESVLVDDYEKEWFIDFIISNVRILNGSITSIRKD